MGDQRHYWAAHIVVGGSLKSITGDTLGHESDSKATNLIKVPCSLPKIQSDHYISLFALYYLKFLTCTRQ